MFYEEIEKLIQEFDFEDYYCLEDLATDANSEGYSYYWGECKELLEKLDTWACIEYYTSYTSLNFGGVPGIDPFKVAGLIYANLAWLVCYKVADHLEKDITDELQEEDYKKIVKYIEENSDDLAKEFEIEFDSYL